MVRRSAVAALLLVVGCAPITIHTVQNPRVSLAGHQSFSFGTPEQAPRGFHRSPLSPEVLAKVQPQVRSFLILKGYKEVETGGDIVVRIGSGVHMREGAPDPTADIDMDTEIHYTEGTLAIDAFDGASNALAWHGSAQAVITPKHLDYDQLSSAVSQILARFPAAGVQ